MEKIIREWQDCDKIKIFEIPVTNKRNYSKDYVTFNIEIIGGQFVAQHEPLNQAQRESKFIASVKVAIDPDFSLDENLQELYNACKTALSESEFYELIKEA